MTKDEALKVIAGMVAQADVVRAVEANAGFIEDVSGDGQWVVHLPTGEITVTVRLFKRPTADAELRKE